MVNFSLILWFFAIDSLSEKKRSNKDGSSEKRQCHIVEGDILVH